MQFASCKNLFPEMQKIRLLGVRCQEYLYVKHGSKEIIVCFYLVYIFLAQVISLYKFTEDGHDHVVYGGGGSALAYH